MRLISIVILLALSQVALAATVGTRVDVIAAAGGPEENSALTDFQQAFDPSQASAAAISPHAGASADAFAGFGVIKVMAQANSQSGGYSGAANATGSWTDIVTLSSAGFNDVQARITASVTLQGFISPVGTGRGTAHLEFDMGNAGTSVNGAWDTSTPINATGFPSAGLNVQPGGTLFYSNIHEVTLNIKLGNSFVLTEELTVSAASKPACPLNNACLNSDSGSVDSDFGHSSYWNGITSIAVLNPNTGFFEDKDLSLFTLSSSSGTNYFESFVPAVVPLPAAVWLLMPALGLLAATRRAVT